LASRRPSGQDQPLQAKPTADPDPVIRCQAARTKICVAIF
jgi:hypothetical protein